MLDRPERETLEATIKLRAAERLAHEVQRLVERGVIGSRSEAADALLDYHDGKIPALAAAPDARLAELERKAAAYDAARAVVKTEGNTRAYYVLRAEAAEAEVARLAEALREANGAATRADDPGHIYVRFPVAAWDILRAAAREETRSGGDTG